MASPVILQESFHRGMRRDESRQSLPRGASWNLINWIPNLDNAPLGERGGWTYGSSSLSVVRVGAAYVPSVVYAEFIAGSKLVAMDEDGIVYDVATSGSAASAGSATTVPLQRPVLHSDKLVIPASDGTTTPIYWTGAGSTSSVTAAPAGRYIALYADRTVLGNTIANPTRFFFSAAADPMTWNTDSATGSFFSVQTPITGLAPLPNALMVFQNRVTSRIRGKTPPPGTDMILDDPIFNVGCTDARSIAVNGSYCVFANPTGVWLSNGTNIPQDLTEIVGLKRYWVDLLANYASGTWTLAGGFYRNLYVISVMNGATFVDCLVFDIPQQIAYRLSNIQAASMGSAVTIANELYFGSRIQPRVNKFSTVFSPSATVKNDADGAAVAATGETAFYRGRPGKKTWKYLYLSLDMRDAATDNPTMTVSYIKNPEDAYTAISPALNETSNVSDPIKVPLRFPSAGIALRLVRANASSAARLYTLMADVHAREGGRV